MKFNDLKEKVEQAINILYTNDSFLFTVGSSEWSIAHKLAVYLEKLIPGWNVDCEYNRQGVNKKEKTGKNGKKVRPDIILHHRGRVELEHNLLAIEIKTREDQGNDSKKVKKFTTSPEGKRRYQYQYGLFLLLMSSPSSTVIQDPFYRIGPYSQYLQH
jgi:hypothetical protein